jgi:hypothetical protein
MTISAPLQSSSSPAPDAASLTQIMSSHSFTSGSKSQKEVIDAQLDRSENDSVQLEAVDNPKYENEDLQEVLAPAIQSLETIVSKGPLPEHSQFQEWFEPILKEIINEAHNPKKKSA